jgi:hypothetical protein
MTDRKLSDNQVHDRLVAAAEALAGPEAETLRGQTALDTARKAMVLLQLGLVAAMEKAEEAANPSVSGSRPAS